MNVAKQTVYMGEKMICRSTPTLCVSSHIWSRTSNRRPAPLATCFPTQTVWLFFRSGDSCIPGWDGGKRMKWRKNANAGRAVQGGKAAVCCSANPSLHFWGTSVGFVRELRWECLHNQALLAFSTENKSAPTNPISFSLQTKWDFFWFVLFCFFSASRWSSS